MATTPNYLCTIIVSCVYLGGLIITVRPSVPLDLRIPIWKKNIHMVITVHAFIPSYRIRPSLRAIDRSSPTPTLNLNEALAPWSRLLESVGSSIVGCHTGANQASLPQ